MRAKNFVPPSKPRNFVAKNSKTAGAGAHKDKKRAEKQGDVKHKAKQYEQGVAEGNEINREVEDLVQQVDFVDIVYKIARQKYPQAKFEKLDDMRIQVDVSGENNDPFDYKNYQGFFVMGMTYSNDEGTEVGVLINDAYSGPYKGIILPAIKLATEKCLQLVPNATSTLWVDDDESGGIWNEIAKKLGYKFEILNEGNQSVAEGSPNFNREWDEATRYPEFVNLGKEKWIELVSKGKQVTVTRKNVNKINNTDAADPKSFKLLDPEKQKRALAQLANGDVEMPIVARYSDGYLELIGGNTRLTAQMAKDSQAKVWLFNVPEELMQGVSENFADGRNPQDKGDSRRHGIPKHASLSQLDKIRSSKTASPRKKQLAHWQANMRRGRMKEATDIQLLAKHYFPVDDEHIIVKYKMKQDSKGYYLPQWNTSGRVFDANYSSLNRLYGRPHTVKAKEFINEFQRSPGHRGNDNDGIISWKAAKAAFKQLADDSNAVDFEERDGGNTVSTTWGPEPGAPYARYIMFVHPHGDGQIRGMLLGLYEDGELDEIQKFVLPCSMNGVDHAHRIYMQVRS